MNENFLQFNVNASMLFTPNVPVNHKKQNKNSPKKSIKYFHEECLSRKVDYTHIYPTLYVAGCYDVAGTIQTIVFIKCTFFH